MVGSISTPPPWRDLDDALPVPADVPSSSGDPLSGAPTGPRRADIVLTRVASRPRPAFQKCRSRSTTVSVELVAPPEGPPQPVLEFCPAATSPPAGEVQSGDRPEATNTSSPSALPSHQPLASHPLPVVGERELPSTTRWLGEPSLDAPQLPLSELCFPWRRRGHSKVMVEELTSCEWLRPDLARIFKIYEAGGAEEASSSSQRLMAEG